MTTTESANKNGWLLASGILHKRGWRKTITGRWTKGRLGVFLSKTDFTGMEIHEVEFRLTQLLIQSAVLSATDMPSLQKILKEYDILCQP